MPTLVVWADGELGVTIQMWLDTLSPEQIAELTSLEAGYNQYRLFSTQRSDQARITMDWVEEHGGERTWWRGIGLKDPQEP